jgi:hypothetical protein
MAPKKRIPMQKKEALKTQRYFDKPEIDAHLFGVEYIIMAAPSTRENAKAPIHFTIFLNTQEVLPPNIQEAVLKKFAAQYNITEIHDVFSQLDSVAFAQTSQETPMPLHLFKEEDKRALPHTIMHVIDFEGDSPDFKEPKEGMTGWSYSYN